MPIRFVRISRASWIKIASHDAVIHIDPGYTGYPQNQALPSGELDGKADLILISHFHKDHLQPDALKWLRDDRTVIVAPASCVPRIGGPVTVVQPGDALELNSINIRVLHAYNTIGGRSTRKVHHRGVGVAYIVSIDGKTIYHAGDTDLIPEMSELGRIDVAFLPIGGIFVMDGSEAAKATLLIRPEIVVPMHEGRADIETFARTVKSESATVVKHLQPGDTFEIGNG